MKALGAISKFKKGSKSEGEKKSRALSIIPSARTPSLIPTTGAKKFSLIAKQVWSRICMLL